MANFSFEDITCTLGRYTKGYFDCAKENKMRENAVYSGIVKNVFVPFRNNLPFPIFTDTVFKKTTVNYPYDLFDFKGRTGIKDPYAKPENANIYHAGRILVLKRKNDVDKKTKYFFIWISQSLWDKYRNQSNGNFKTNIHINFHPVGHINDIKEYPPYYNERIEQQILNTEDPKDSFYSDNKYYNNNYFTIGIRYLFLEKQAVLQQRCSLKKGGQNTDISSNEDGIPMMVIIPVSGGAPYFADLSNVANLQEITKAVSDFCFDIAQKEKGRSTPIENYPTIGRVACSFYSRSGMIAEQLLSQRPEFIHEFYLYDVMLDMFHFIEDKTTAKPKKIKVVDRTQEKGFERVWHLMKQWRQDNSDKKIRIYSAYSTAIELIRAELKRSRYDENLAIFSAFNDKPDKAGGTYSNLSDGYEIYNADKSISVVSIPIKNFAHYLDDIKSPGGFAVYDNYLEDVGHSWFVRRLQTHSLYHSGFN